jgi:hypothetical protein
LVALALISSGFVHAEGRIQFNETFIRGLRSTQDMNDKLGVFAQVFAELPTKVFVYPTENYYYFAFTANGQVYSGNVRLSPDAWMTHRIHFAYGENREAASTQHICLGPEHGVLVEALGAFRYRVSFADKRVEFQLNELPQTLPQGFQQLPWEIFLGRSMDESGIGFLLMYSLAYDHFFWVLDEQLWPDWSTQWLAPSLQKHPGSGFVFFVDLDLERRVLVGVDRSEVLANSYFDGPFDQLPDNFIAPTPFAELAQRAFPSIRGRINRHGEYWHKPARIALLNYRIYSDPGELIGWTNSCLARGGNRAALYDCLTRISASPR